MTNKYSKVGRYVASDMMGELICDNYPMVFVLNRFGIALGFGDKSIGEVCAASNVDVDTFLSVVNLLISDDKGGSGSSSAKSEFEGKVSIPSLMIYLHNSHNYFLEYRLPALRQKLVEALGANSGEEVVNSAIIGYFDEYVAEVRKHMAYEESTVFEYVNSLLEGRDTTYDIQIFSEHHDKVEAKLSELKNILIKYYPAAATNQLCSVMFDIFVCEADLASHNDIEDYLLVPAIRSVENPGCKA
ncbi:MAG: hemerythrin domain-containing protein [Rikenellaceae bacterium]